MIGIEPPKDAEGREIPLSTKFLYSRSGRKVEVVSFIYLTQQDEFRVAVADLLGGFATSDFLLSPPDSWENLERDATLAPRDYLQARGLNEHKNGRIATMMLDLVNRAKALAEREKR